LSDSEPRPSAAVAAAALSIGEPMTSPSEAPTASPIGRAERWALALLVLGGLVLRGILIARREFDTDEAQHFHVAWGWANGRVQYRDLWDNHMPLFHLATAPLAWLFGERADILVLARIAMVPLTLVMLGATYTIGVRLWNRRVGLWAAAMLAVHAEFLNKSLEFRADDLWAAFWLLSLAVLVGGPFRPRRALAAGLLAGFALATSLKTSLLLMTFAAAGVVVLLVSSEARARWSLRRDASALGLYVAGAVAPAAIAFATFGATGLLDPFLDCTVRHNAGIQLESHGGLGGGYALFSGLLAVLVVAAWGYVRLFGRADAAPRRLLLLAWVGLQVITIETVWPVVARQDVLPSVPIAALGLAAALIFVCDREAARARERVRRVLPVALLAAFVIVAVVRLTPKDWQNGAPKQIRLLKDVLALTDRSDVVMDCKGETVFRDRAFRPVLELLTRARLESGEMKDGVREACVEQRAYVLAPDRVPASLKSAWKFFFTNYLPVGPLWVAGQRFGAASGPVERTIDFDLEVQGRYVVVDETLHAASGSLDGRSLDGALDLAAGRHTLRLPPGPSRTAVVWEKAIDRGFNPFATPYPGEKP
jgi:hypothetical protein